MTSFLQDLRGGVRGLLKSPLSTFVAALTIAVGIGVNTTMFSIVEAVLLRPLPYGGADRLVALNADLPGMSLTNIGFSVPEMDDLSAKTDVFEMVSPVWVFDANLTGGQRPERVVMVASGTNYFQLLGATPQLGRVIGPQDKADGFAEAVVLSDAAWRRLFGGDPSAIGKQVRIDTDLYTIVGVMPPDFRHPAAAPAPNIDLWSTAGFRANPFQSPPVRRQRMLPSAIARLRPGVSIDQSRAALGTLAASTLRDHAADYPADGRWSIRVDPLQSIVVGNVSPLLLAFSGAVALVLLIGCVNVANLLLARASTRHREIAIRLALGAGRSRLIRQLLTENLVLATVGGAIGVLAASWTQSLIIAAMPATLPRIHEIGIDWIAVIFAAAITIATTLVCGIAPALQASRTRPVAAIAEVGRGLTPGRRQRRLRTALVVAEIAVSLVLVTGAGLLVATVTRLLDVDPGFDPNRVTAARTWIAVPNNPELDPYRTPVSRVTLVKRLIDRLRAIPGVEAAAMTTIVPIEQAPPKVPIQIPGRTLDAETALAGIANVSPDYFSLLRVPVVRGRAFAESDDGTSRQVVIVDEELERRFFDGQDAVGRSIQIGRSGPNGAPPSLTIVGVVKTIKQERLDEAAAPHIYVPLYQRTGRSLGMLVKTRGQDAGIQERMRTAVLSVDGDLPVFSADSLDATIGRSIASQRFSARALVVFAAFALLLVIGGVYGVMAYGVTTQTQEFGVRIAMGASPSTLLRSVLGEALRTSMTGVVLGLVLAAATTRFIRTMLFGVSAVDPRIYVIAGVLLIASALLASYLPARRAASVDPLVSLRSE
jgi:putative ABC transport system permease protein